MEQLGACLRPSQRLMHSGCGHGCPSRNALWACRDKRRAGRERVVVVVVVEWVGECMQWVRMWELGSCLS